MRIVFDTNVLVSAFVFSGLSAEVYEYCHSFHEIAVSERLIAEFMTVLRRKLGVAAMEVRQAELLLRRGVTVVEAVGKEPRVCRDPDDDHVLHLAASCGAKLIVTGDKDLLDINSFRGIAIVTPRVFLERLHSRRRARQEKSKKEK